MPADKVGSLALVLHSHIPYVLSHGRWPHGSDWLLEVTAESYIPLLDALYDLVEDGCSPKITIGLTPVLMEQLADESFKHEFTAYASMRAKAAAADKRAFHKSNEQHLAYLADVWHEFYSTVVQHFKKRYKRSLLSAFKELQDAGHIEIITSSATHGYSPLLSQDESLHAQVKMGVQTYARHFGCKPSGYWLPECAYRPGYKWSPPLQPKRYAIEPYDRKGVEEFLRENELKYFFAESHLLHGGETKGVYIDRFGALQKLWKNFSREFPDLESGNTPYLPYMVESGNCENEPPVHVFFRDHITGEQVWSRWQGYPGDEWYLEFHKKHSSGGMRYWRVTGPDLNLGDKLVYDPKIAEERTDAHAAHFAERAKEVLKANLDATGTPGVICAPYDTELYGHWWFEGVRWLAKAIKAISDDPNVELVTCSEYLKDNPTKVSISLPEGSWGEGGFHYMWLNEHTEWSWSYVYDAELEMKELVKDFGDNDEILPILKQAARELLLLQSSDWQFSISTRTSKEYGEQRLTEHYKAFQTLARLIRKKANGEKIEESEWKQFKVYEERDCLFPDIDPTLYG